MTRAIRLLPFLLLAGGCSTYQRGRPVEALPEQPMERDRYEFWTQGTGHQLHAVRITPDSVSGVSWLEDPHCDSCRVAFARSAIDSVRTLKYDGGATGAMGLLILPFAALVMLEIALHGMN